MGHFVENTYVHVICKKKKKKRKKPKVLLYQLGKWVIKYLRVHVIYEESKLAKWAH